MPSYQCPRACPPCCFSAGVGRPPRKQGLPSAVVAVSAVHPAGFFAERADEQSRSTQRRLPVDHHLLEFGAVAPASLLVLGRNEVERFGEKGGAQLIDGATPRAHETGVLKDA